MPEHQLTTYIKEARKQGMTHEQIVDALAKAGWRMHEILEVVLEHPIAAPAQAAALLPAAAPSDAIISVRGISKSYSKLKALDNVSLNVKRSSVTAVLGPNGAGKTTLIRILTTLLQPTAGQATVAGFDVVRDAQHLRSAIGLAGQSVAVDEILTGRENLEMVGRLYHLKPAEAKKRAAELLGKFDLEDAADRLVKTYSGGMHRRLDLAASLVLRPKMLFLDEPTTGLDPRSRFALWNIIRDLVADGTTVLLTTQYLEEADQLAHYIFVVDHGHIIAQGTADELKRQVGGEVLELHLADRSQAPKAVTVIKRFGNGAEPQISPGTGVITMPAPGGTAVLVDVVRELDSNQLKIADIILRRPSLDDVFMKLTGHATDEIQ